MGQAETYKNWIAEIDMRGPAMDLKWLETHIQNAPKSIQNHPDFYYFKGYMMGRSVYEDKICDVQSAFHPIRSCDNYYKRKIQNGLDLTAQELVDHEYFKGFLDAQVLHEELGGI